MEEIEEKKITPDHREIISEQKLVMFHKYMPKAAIYLPHGATIYNKLVSLIKKQYKLRGYKEVITPVMFDTQLWKNSGHYDLYKENMFIWKPGNSEEKFTSSVTSTKSIHSDVSKISEKCSIKDEELKTLKHMEDVEVLKHSFTEKELSLKPMNCPCHCLIYNSTLHSYRDLPIRFADFGSLHRNEVSGSLSGLTRMIKFEQDDAHIFCRPDQVRDEIMNILQFIKYIYGIFNFEFSLALSTRPDKYIGDVALWNNAEEELKSCIGEFLGSSSFTIKDGDGAFYGPKIDIELKDSLGRGHQCATIQLDYQLPQRFELTYQTSEGKYEPPVMIHRAIFGSLQRFMAVLSEHLNGKWPFWLSPRQIIVIPITDKNMEYAKTVYKNFLEQDFDAELYTNSGDLSGKIALAHQNKFNFAVILGNKEQTEASITIRNLQLAEKKLQKFSTFDEAAIYFHSIYNPLK